MIEITTTTDARIDSLPTFAQIACPNMSLFADQHRHLSLSEIADEAIDWDLWSQEATDPDVKKRARNFARKYARLHTLLR